ncbi:hypothetical protein [Variovorax sp.]|uniref:hypothetical protein n=1 Tax=Variovorax sp. TaxID=1871043 RepID=UPI003BA8A585
MLDIPQTTFDEVGKNLSQYYEKEMAAGARVLLDRMRTKDWGVVSAAFAQKSDMVERTWDAFRAKSNDSFSVPYKKKLTMLLSEYCGNTADVQRLVVKGVAALARAGLGKIPIPGASVLKTLVTKSVGIGVSAVSGVEGGIDGYLHGKSINEADTVLTNRGNQETAVLFRDDREAMEAAEAAMKQYKHIANLINSMPDQITDLNDAVLYPGVAAKVRISASDLRQQLIKITTFVEGMQMRAERVAELMHKDSDQIAARMVDVARDVVLNAYHTARADGRQALSGMAAKGKPYEYTARPMLKPLSASEGGITQLANLVAYALTLGQHDALEISHPTLMNSSNPAVQVGRPRSNAVVSPGGYRPPVPPRPLPPRPVPPPLPPRPVR